jgi:hypothetical protein
MLGWEMGRIVQPGSYAVMQKRTAGVIFLPNASARTS